MRRSGDLSWVITIIVTVPLIAMVVVLIGCTRRGMSRHPTTTTNEPLRKVAGNPPPEAVRGKETKSNYIWIDYYKLQEGRYWIQTLEDGESLYLQFDVLGTDKIKKIRSGSLPKEEVTGLFSLFKKVNFFRMGNQDPLSNQGIIYEGDILTVFAQLQGKSHQVNARPPGFIPKGLNKIVDAAEEKISKLEPQSGHKTFIRLGKVSPERVEKLKKTGQQIISWEDRLPTNLLAMKAAFDNPGLFVALEPQEFKSINRYLSNNNYPLISISGKIFQVEAFHSK